MATRKIPEEPLKEAEPELAAEDDIEEDDFSFSSPVEDKPKTGQDLYRALVENGFIGAWKDRTDIGDSVEYVRKLRSNSVPTRSISMAARKIASSDVSDDAVSENELIDDDTLGWPSSSPDKKPLTGKALLESGLVGLWKDRTDIGDTLEYVQRLKDQGRKRRQKRIRKYIQG